MLDIDTRADVYALGVLLYELLTGTTPLSRKRLKSAALRKVLAFYQTFAADKGETEQARFAAAAGQFRVAIQHVQKDDDLAALRDRADFKQFVAELVRERPSTRQAAPAKPMQP